MLKGLTYKKKNRFLWGALFLFTWIIYSYSISDTLQAWNDCDEMEQRSAQAADAPMQSAVLEKRLSEMEALIGSGKQGASDVRQELMGIAAAWCQESRCTLREFPATILTEERDLRVETNILTLEGNFKELLGLVYKLEQKDKSGKLASVDFQMKKDPKTKNRMLTATIYIQNITKAEQQLASNEK